MPLFDLLANSSSLTIKGFSDFEHFQSIEKLVEASSIPLDGKNFAVSLATTKIGSCSIHLQRTFPRILQARYSTTGAIVGFAMDDMAAVTVDGVETRAPTLLLIRGNAVCDLVERRANLVALVNFEFIGDRGWPEGRDRVQLIAARPAEFQVLRVLTRDILTLASNSPAAFLHPGVIENLEESLLQAVDHAIHSALPVLEARRSDLAHYLSLVRKLDEILHFGADKTSQSAEVAKQLGVSVRTLHNAVVAIRGMSMQRYTRLRRLWNVRRHLMQGVPADAIKAVALANGFWHMGEFSSLYCEQFGETPHQTLLSSRAVPP